jgi:hypothetical protein
MLPKILGFLRSRAAVADGMGSLNHTVANDQSVMREGDGGGGIFDFPSIDSLVSRPTLLQYITALEKQHRLAKHKLRGLAKDEQQVLDAGDAPKASDPPASVISPASVARNNTLLSPQGSRIRAATAAGVAIPTEQHISAMAAARPSPLSHKISRTPSEPATPSGSSRAQTGWMDKSQVVH